MNQIAILGVALLIAYSAGVPVNQEQNTGNLAINSANSTIDGTDDYCFWHGEGIGFKTLCEYLCPCVCQLDVCGGFDQCKLRDDGYNYDCFCKNPKKASSNSLRVTLSNEGKPTKDLLPSLAQNEQVGEVAANH